MINYKFSIITPTHKYTSYLDELFECIKNQTYTNWEWILCLNGRFKTHQIPEEIKNHPQVKVNTNYVSNQTKVGYYKLHAFNMGEGDVLVEVDHDDLISLNCLEELNIAYQNQETGFVYSNCLIYDLREDSNPVARQPWVAKNGWTYTKEKFRGEEYIVHDTFPATSHTLSIIWYAPDHIRSWRKNIYHQVGGHNPELSICDDQELMIRTYMVTKFYHIPKTLYYYRFLPSTELNTQTERLDDIQVQTFELLNQYGVALAQRDAELNNLLSIELNEYLYKEDVDLNDKIPLDDDSVGVLSALHVLQKLKNPIKSMKEIYRVLKDGGWAIIEVPSTDGRGAFQDPTHVSYWNQNSFLYYTDKTHSVFIDNTDIKFQVFRNETVYLNEWSKENNCPVTIAWLCAIKSDKKRPHPVNI